MNRVAGNRGVMRALLFVGVLSGMLMVGREANAWWGWRCGPAGYISGYSCTYSGGYACYRPYYWRGCGLLGRLFGGWRAYPAGYWTCYDPCWTCCGVCGCYDCCCGVTQTVIEYDVPSTPRKPTPADSNSDSSNGGESQGKTTSVGRDNAFLTVSVPEDARILVNGVATRSTGDVRRYVSRNLSPGFDYTYEVQAEMMVGGERVTRARTIQLRAGEEANLAFDMEESEPVETALTVHVPEDAEVYLAGSSTHGDGTVRTFRTTALEQGESWSDYLVRVKFNDGGAVRTMEERITLRGGDQRDLSFDFDAEKVASVR
ncbi:MAG: TIGR03000 domain-containing protein [Pirellulaceae bacterium]